MSAMEDELHAGSTRLADLVHRQLLGLITSGELASGSRLHQLALADRLGVSRTPVREALLRMEREGLVYTVPRRGMFLRSFTSADVAEFYELREVLEPWAAEMACRRAGEADRVAVQAIQRRHERRGPRFEDNRELHLRLLACCGNKPALRVIEGLWEQDSTARMYAVYDGDRAARDQMVAEHRDIVDAFVRGRAQRVRELTRRHIAAAAKMSISHFRATERAGGDG